MNRRTRSRRLHRLSLLAGLVIAILAAAQLAPLAVARAAEENDSFVGGKVFIDDDGDGKHDRGESYVRGVTLTLKRSDRSGEALQTSSNERGDYQFRGLRSGTYLLTLGLPDGYRGTTGQQYEVRLDGSNGTRDADFGLTAETSAGGRPAAASGGTSRPAPAAPTTAQLLAQLSSTWSAHFRMTGQSSDNELLTDFAAEGDLLRPDALEMNLAMNEERPQLIMVGQRAYQREPGEEYWRRLDSCTLRGWHGALAPLDLLTLSNLSTWVREIRPAELSTYEGRPVRRYVVQLGPPPNWNGAVQQCAPQLLGGSMDLWISPGDNLIQLAQLQIDVPSSRTDLEGQVWPARINASIHYSDQNVAYTITEPTALQPTPAPAPRPAAAAAPAPRLAAPAPAPTRVEPTPTTDLSVAAEVAAERTRASERSAAVERALQALYAAAGPQPGSTSEAGRVRLAVPWRGEVVDPSGSRPPGDAPASLGMVLEAYGVAAEAAALEALIEEWQGTWTAEEPARLETLIRIGARGSLRPLGPAYGTGGDEWSAEVARDYLRRGYPILALVRPAFLAEGSADEGPPNRYVVLIGFEGDTLVYHDPSTPDGAARTVEPARLELAWANASSQRQAVALGFGTNVAGLLAPAGRQVAVAPTPEPAPTLEALPTVATIVIEPTPIDPKNPVAGFSPLLLGFFVLLTGGAGFALARLIR